MCLRKRFFYCFFLFLQVASYSQTYQQADSVITEEELKKVVYYLASDSLQGRFGGSWQADTAASFIAREMDSIGLKKVQGLNGYFDEWDSKFKYVRNVIGMLPGTTRKQEVVIISAHYDHIGVLEEWKPKKKRDVVYNGANDNASGIAVMLSLASYFTLNAPQRSIMFIAFGKEETGLWGSKAFSSAVDPKLIVAQLNLEMLGRKDVYKKPIITGHWHSNLRELLNTTLYDSLHVPNYFEKDATGYNLFERSDNFPLAQLGIPAHSIMLGTDADPLYHQLGDEAQTLDYKMMCDIARKIAVAVTPLVNGSITPSRINVSKLP